MNGTSIFLSERLIELVWNVYLNPHALAGQAGRTRQERVISPLHASIRWNLRWTTQTKSFWMLIVVGFVHILGNSEDKPAKSAFSKP